MPTSRQRRTAAQTQKEPEHKGLKVSQAAVARSRQKPAQASQSIDPFVPAAFPPSVHAGGAALALDEATTQDLAWAAQAYQGYVLSEGMAFLGYPYLSLLAQRGEYRRVVETIATEMTRKWIRLVAPGGEDKADRIDAMEKALERLCVRDAFRKVAEHDGFFGRAHLHIGLKGDDALTEAASSIGAGSDLTSRSKIKKGALQHVRAVEPIWAAPNPMAFNTTDPLSPGFYRPDAWNVMGRQVHGTRLLTFVGREVPDVLKAAYGFGGLSMTQMAKPYVDNWLKTRESVSDLIASFSVSGVKGMDLADALASGGDAFDNLINRIEVFTNLRDNRGFMGLNGSEEFFNVSTPLNTLDKLQAQAQEQIASICGIPLVKLLGVTPSGLNASSDGEVRVFYDFIHAYQEKFFAPNLKRVLAFVQLSEFGDVDEDITFEFLPLWEMSELEKAQVASERTKAVMGAESLMPSHVALKELSQMAEPTGVFTQITDDVITDAEAAPPLPEALPDDADERTGREPLPDRSEALSRLPQAAE